MPERRNDQTTLAVRLIASLLTAIVALSLPIGEAGQGQASARDFTDDIALTKAVGLRPCAVDHLDCRAFTGTLE